MKLLNGKIYGMIIMIFLKTMTFPEVIRTKMIEFIETEKSINKYYIEKKQIIKLRKYQEEAIESWQNNNYKGIFFQWLQVQEKHTHQFRN